MAKSRKNEEPPRSGQSPQEQAERLARNLGGSAHQIWLAGMGAFGRAQVEGTKLFENLAREGSRMESNARQFADHQTQATRSAIESSVASARHQAAGTWERLEKTFEDRVYRTLDKFGVPAREDLTDLSRRVDALTAELRKQGASPAPARAAAKKTARPAAPRSPAKSPPRKASAKKAPARKAGAKKSTRRAPASGPASKR